MLNVIEVRILSGWRQAEDVFIPRILLIASGVPFQIQFPDDISQRESFNVSGLPPGRILLLLCTAVCWLDVENSQDLCVCLRVCVCLYRQKRHAAFKFSVKLPSSSSSSRHPDSLDPLTLSLSLSLFLSYHSSLSAHTFGKSSRRHLVSA